MKLYQLYDVTAERTAGPIITEHGDAPAIRAFHDLLNKGNSLPAEHPDDFILYCIGEQDDNSMEIQSLIQVVATGAGWRQQKEASANAQQ